MILTSAFLLKRLATVTFFILTGVCTLTSAQTLRIGLPEDPDLLDPTLARSYVGRIVFASMCDKLFDVDEKANIVPQLATEFTWSNDNKALTLKLRPGVTFQDGEKFDADAVKFNLERHKNMPGSNRRGEVAPIEAIDVVDPLTIRIRLSQPYVPLLATLSDRAGMMVSPRAARAAGEKFALNPVCAGPFKFSQRIAQDRIILDRYDGYWNRAAIHFEHVVFLPIVDPTVRLANLKSGQLDFVEQVAPTDFAGLKSDARIKTARIVGLNYQGLTINVGKSEQSQANPLGRDARVREALELSLDRSGIVAAVHDGEAVAGNQWVSPNNPYYAKSLPVPAPNLERAKALLKEAKVEHPSFSLMTPTNAESRKLAEVVQAMAKDAGFDVKIQSVEFATSLNQADQGAFEAYLLAWSGRVDPDGNLYSFVGCKQPLNYSGYCDAEVDTWLNDARAQSGIGERAKIYDRIAHKLLTARPTIYLYHSNILWAYSAKLTGVRLVPDGLIRPQGLQFNP
ncbi:MAG: ABC transporter substrate-binding protein [Burkholderiaceae bacterium]